MSTVVVRGPLSEHGRPERAVASYLTEVLKAAGERGVELVKANLHGVLRHPTGHYESQVQCHQVDSLNEQVDDGGIIYGPWLEGTGSRNRTTRFKGYATFRRTGQQLDSEVGRIAEEKMPKLIEELT